MPLRQQGVGWDATCSRKLEFKWGEVEWVVIPAFASLFQSHIWLEMDNSCWSGYVGYLCNCVWVHACWKLLLLGRGVTLAVWWLLVKLHFREQEDRNAEGVSAPFLHTHTLLKPIFLATAWLLKGQAGLMNHHQPLSNQNAAAKFLGRETVWLKCTWNWRVPDKQMSRRTDGSKEKCL